MVDIPMRLPKVLYYRIFPPTAEDYSVQFSLKRVVLAFGFFIANVLIYSIPAFIFLTLISRFRERQTQTTDNDSPPAPPSFDA